MKIVQEKTIDRARLQIETFAVRYRNANRLVRSLNHDPIWHPEAVRCARELEIALRKSRELYEDLLSDSL